jgi:hypothetical protein
MGAVRCRESPAFFVTIPRGDARFGARRCVALGSPAVLPVGRGMKARQVLTEGEKIRRRELVRDSKSALEQGLTLEQFVANREQTVDD